MSIAVSQAGGVIMSIEREHDVCSVCGRTIINAAVNISDSDPKVTLKNGEVLCMPCAGKIRIMYIHKC